MENSKKRFSKVESAGGEQPTNHFFPKCSTKLSVSFWYFSNLFSSVSQIESQRLLTDLAQDIADCLMEITMSPKSIPPEAVFSNNGVTNTLSQDYFLLIGQIARDMHGEQIMEKVGMFQ